MSHEITAQDTMISVAATPWHKLGKVLDNPPTVAEAIKLAGLDWTVRTEPIFASLPNIDSDGTWSYQARKAPGKVVVRNDTGAILGTVGGGFTPLQNVKALEWFQPWIDSGKVSIETAGSLRGGGVVWALAKIKSDPIVIKGNDIAEKYVLIAHGHDGRLAVRAGTTAVRVVCANTLSMAVRGGDDSGLFKISHTANVSERIEGVRAAIEMLDARLTTQGEVYRKLASVEVTNSEERIVEFMGAVYRERFDDIRKGRRLQQVSELFESGTGQDLDGAHGTYWGLANALTEYVTHHAGRTPESRAQSTLLGPGRGLINRGIDVAYAMATGRTITVEDAFGQFSDAAMLAVSEHPDALHLDRDALAA